MDVKMTQTLRDGPLGGGPYIVWSIYPVSYKEALYVIELVAHNLRNAKGPDGVLARCDVFEYNEVKRLFKGHRGRKIWSCDVTHVKISEDKILHLPRTTAEEFETHIPQIINIVFAKYEKAKSTPDPRLKETKTLDWDGIVTLEDNIE